MAPTTNDFIKVLRFEALILGNFTLLLKRMPYIYYLFHFKKDHEKIQALINSGSEVNAMTLAYTEKLGFQTWKTDVKAQKFDSSSLATYGMVIAEF